jgi:hypothetical protein
MEDFVTIYCYLTKENLLKKEKKKRSLFIKPIKNKKFRRKSFFAPLF